MSLTGISKRIACFYDDKGEYIGKKAFSKTDKNFSYMNRSFNVFHEHITYTLVKRWYWDLELYHYNINNPNPFDLHKKAEPILDAEIYDIQLKTKVARDLNDLAKGGLELNFKTVAIGLVIIVILYMLISGQVKLK